MFASSEEFVFYVYVCVFKEYFIYSPSEHPMKLIILLNVFHAHAVEAFALFDIVINWVREICGSIQT